MKITKACDYAVRTLVYMAKHDEGKVFMRNDLAKLNNVPCSFLGKILQNLTRADILISERGKNGGFRLSKDLELITLYDVVLATEGEINITDCIADKDYCHNVSLCKTRNIWLEIQGSIHYKLKETTLANLI